METLTIGIIRLSILIMCRAIEIIAMIFVSAGVVLLLISIAWGIYDRIVNMKNK